MNKTTVLCIAIAILSFGLGWQTSNRLASRDDGNTPDAQSGVPFGDALYEALSDGDSTRRILRLAQLFESMSVDQLPEAIEVYDQEMRSFVDIEIKMFFEAWANYDPQAALAHIDIWSNNQNKREAAYGAVIESWARRDPEAARQATDEILKDTPMMRSISLDALIAGWVQSGQPGAIDYLRAGPEYFRTIGTVSLVSSQARRLATEELKSWADMHLRANDDPQFNREIFRRVAKTLARRDPVVAVAWVDRYAGEDYADERERLRLIITSGLRRDPDTVFAWAETFKPGPDREQPIRSESGEWLSQDFAGAAAYIEGKLENESLTTIHDPMISAYARALTVKSRWEPSIAWTQRIENDKLRIATLKGVASSWLRKDPAGAEPWLANSALTEEDREQVRKLVARPRNQPTEIKKRLNPKNRK